MEIIDLTMDEVIDISGEEEVVQDIMNFIEQNLPQFQHLNGYISDDGFVVAPGEGESEVEDHDDDDDEEDVVDDQIHQQIHQQIQQQFQQQQSQQPRGQVHSECSICLENVTEADEGGNVTILPCGHTFHNVCMNGWLLAKPEGECPTCKGTIVGAQNI